MPLDPTIWNPGLAGPAGADGNTILHGAGAPSDLIGVDNDFYIDTLTYDLYGPKTGGVWTTYVNLIGAAGADGIQGLKGDKGDPGLQGNQGTPGVNGATIHAGLGAPLVSEGVNGDFYFDITNKDFYGPKTAGAWGVPVSLNGEDAVVQDAAYGQLVISLNTDVIAFTAASPTDLTDNTDYIQIAGIWDAIPHGLNHQFTQGTNSLTCNRTGKYMIHLWASLTSDTNATNMAFKFAINGVIGLQRRPWRFVRNVGEIHSVSAFGFLELTAGDVITLWAAADKTCNITIQDAVFALTELTASGRQIDIYDEGVLVAEDIVGINFTGAAVTAVEDPAGIAKITITSGITGIEVQEEGVAVGTFDAVNFVGAEVTVTEDPVGVGKITVTAGGGGVGGGGIASALPSGAKYFEELHAAWSGTAYSALDRTYMMPLWIDSEQTFTGVEYSVTFGEPGCTGYFEIHTVLGHGLPGTCVASVALTLTATADGVQSLFSAPITLPPGLYFASFTLTGVVTNCTIAGYASLGAASSARRSSLLISDFWTRLKSTSEMNAVYFEETHLPGGAFTPNADWTGVSLEAADTTIATTFPFFGLIVQ